MSKSYIALVHRPEATSYWGVTFPDFPGCVSAGATFEEAFANAREALAGHVAAMRSDREAIPQPSVFDSALLDTVFAEDIAGGAMPVFVDLIDVPAPKERINIMVDPGTLRRVDQAARAEGVSRSSVFERAAETWINRSSAQAKTLDTDLDAAMQKIEEALSLMPEQKVPKRLPPNVGRLAERRKA
ncbi:MULTISPECIES: type II toxin-antitoxin system HicB family antitoxin [unclassified Bosea (in: a-proteobacteria)]|uniref:type II toxin-antitoxin system HicB family antitoxin n=1 Tax=unclassified Bosea (in: a-proteobacteria) TaxID=2653178 RepID=UPI000F7621BC|nr:MULTISPECIES: type II toxin-antitoxin system HicB family antitoxin [unclassified Bosea (in: a-proteobacteria)]AZO77734.1 hypothetical protein BLM15_08970 [Bosea sp. Tri-49]RXT18348.1 hypothetical protein B5U98_24125 [Bosea sp. Tri-39]RXT32944.1 hypothetical protein B5U99_30470 [Bosea sp. Tri-54]